MPAHLETVHLDVVVLGQPDLLDEGADVVALVALQLDHLPVLRVLHYRAIARKLLFACAYNLLEIVVGGDALHRSECLAAASLLDSYVDITILTPANIIILRERIARIEVLDLRFGHTDSLLLPTGLS